MFSVEIFTDDDAFERLERDWLELAMSVHPRTPFAEPLWHKTWWKHLRRNDWATRDTLAIFAVRDEAGKLIAIAPYMETARPGRGPIALKELQSLGADPNVTEVRGLLCQPEHLLAAMDALRAAMNTRRVRANWISWHHVRWPEGDPSQCGTEECAAPRQNWLRSNPWYVVDMPETWAQFESGLSKSVRKKLRNTHNSLARANIECSFKVVRDPDEVASAVGVCYDLIEQRSLVRHSNPFEKDDVRTFFLDYARKSAAVDQIKVFQLVVEGHVVATRMGFTLGTELYLYYSGNVAEFDRFSVATILLSEIFRWSVANKFRHVNLSTGTDRSKTRWHPREIMLVDAVEPMPGRMNDLLYYFYARARKIERPVAHVTPEFLRARGIRDVEVPEVETEAA